MNNITQSGDFMQMINPLRMCSRATLSVCLRVGVPVTALADPVFSYHAQTWYKRNKEHSVQTLGVLCQYECASVRVSKLCHEHHEESQDKEVDVSMRT